MTVPPCLLRFDWLPVLSSSFRFRAKVRGRLKLVTSRSTQRIHARSGPRKLPDIRNCVLCPPICLLALSYLFLRDSRARYLIVRFSSLKLLAPVGGPSRDERRNSLRHSGDRPEALGRGRSKSKRVREASSVGTPLGSRICFCLIFLRKLRVNGKRRHKRA